MGRTLVSANDVQLLSWGWQVNQKQIQIWEEFYGKFYGKRMGCKLKFYYFLNSSSKMRLTCVFCTFVKEHRGEQFELKYQTNLFFGNDSSHFFFESWTLASPQPHANYSFYCLTFYCLSVLIRVAGKNRSQNSAQANAIVINVINSFTEKQCWL